MSHSLCRHDLDRLANRFALRDCLISELIYLLQVLRCFRSGISDLTPDECLILEALLSQVETATTIALCQALSEAGDSFRVIEIGSCELYGHLCHACVTQTGNAPTA